MPAFGRQKISEQTIRARTGKSLAQWIWILDRWGAKAKGPRATARHLQDDLGLSPWWAQTVTVQYEYAKGLRAPLEIPAEVRRALARAPRAKAHFEQLPRSHQREYVQWVAEAGRPQTRVRRINEMIARLTPRHRR